MDDKVQYIEMPDGSYLEAPANASPEQIKVKVASLFPDAYKPSKDAAIAKLRAGIQQSQGAENRISESPDALNSHWNATKYGIKEAAKGIADVPIGMLKSTMPSSRAEAVMGAVAPQALIVKKGVEGLMELGRQAGEVPAAIRDIANAPDPVSAVGMAAPRALGQGAGTALTQAAMMKGGQLAAAEGNAGKVYNRFLEPVKDVPEALPKMTPYQKNALRREVNKLHPDIAQRMNDGKTTLGDLDTIRTIANKSSQAYFSANGKVPNENSTAFAQAGDALRDTIYPRMEALHGMNPGTLSKIKSIQGDLIAMKSPRMGYSPAEWPARAIDKFGIHPVMEKYFATRTRMLDRALPPPQKITLRQSMLGGNSVTVKTVQPASVELGGPQAPSGLPPRGGYTAINEALPEYGPSPSVNPYALTEAFKRGR